MIVARKREVMQAGWNGANSSSDNCDICDDSEKDRRYFHTALQRFVLDHLTLCIDCAEAEALGDLWHGCGCGG